ncbi:hypothetical protein M0802_003125 [Mischocyttarus mexicanus]|nr:hypothetical protein M0802_003125 [Mischocyttarus mexicanus]
MVRKGEVGERLEKSREQVLLLDSLAKQGLMEKGPVVEGQGKGRLKQTGCLIQRNWRHAPLTTERARRRRPSEKKNS